MDKLDLIARDHLKKVVEQSKRYTDSSSLKVTEATLESLNEIQNKLIPFDGLANQLLMKKSDADFDVSWGGYLCNNNLLDNPIWNIKENIINQRGNTEYVGAVYTIDRWRGSNSSSTVNIKDGYIEIGKGSVVQLFEIKFEELVGKTLTISLLDLDGNLWTATGTIPKEKPSNADEIMIEASIDSSRAIRLIYNGVNSRFRFEIASPSQLINVVAVKFEFGQIQTLAHKEEGVWVLNEQFLNTTLELLKCQRYQVNLVNRHGDNTYRIGFGVVVEAHAVRLSISMPSVMRERPLLVYGGTFQLGKNSGFSGSSLVDVTRFRWPNSTTTEFFIQADTDADLNIGDIYVLYTELRGEEYPYFILDANL